TASDTEVISTYYAPTDSMRRASTPVATGIGALQSPNRKLLNCGVVPSKPFPGLPDAVRRRRHVVRGSATERNGNPFTPSLSATEYRRSTVFPLNTPLFSNVLISECSLT